MQTEISEQDSTINLRYAQRTALESVLEAFAAALRELLTLSSAVDQLRWKSSREGA